jgi:two-component system NtrC family response regulator
MAKVALISKDDALTRLVSEFLKNDKHEVTIYTEYNTEAAIKKSDGFDVVIMDDHDIKSTGKYHPISSPKLIILTDIWIEGLIEMRIREGVWDCIPKPLSLNGKFVPSTVEVVKKRLLRSVAIAVQKNLQEYDIKDLDRTGIVGESQAIKSCLSKLKMAIKSDKSILIIGDTGTGKELFAKAVHKNSYRSKGEMVSFNCAAVPETLAEGLLFGWEKGAHNMATGEKDGLIIQADKGVLFLDEIGELSLGNQARLLRCIQNKEVTRLGANKPIKVDFKLVAATNENITEMVEQGKFRKDLYYRISASIINIPTLKERQEDIKDITDHYIKDICRERQFPQKNYTENFIEALKIWKWPGNIRELINTIDYAISESGDVTTLDIHYLNKEIRGFWTEHSIFRGFDLSQEIRDAIQRESDEQFNNSTFADPKGPAVSIKFIPGQKPTLEECVAKLEAAYFKQLKAKVDEKLMTAEEAHKLAGSKSKYHRKITELNLK